MMVTILEGWPQGHHHKIVNIIQVFPCSTQPAVHKMHTQLGEPYVGYVQLGYGGPYYVTSLVVEPQKFYYP